MAIPPTRAPPAATITSKLTRITTASDQLKVDIYGRTIAPIDVNGNVYMTALRQERY